MYSSTHEELLHLLAMKKSHTTSWFTMPLSDQLWEKPLIQIRSLNAEETRSFLLGAQSLHTCYQYEPAEIADATIEHAGWFECSFKGLMIRNVIIKNSAVSQTSFGDSVIENVVFESCRLFEVAFHNVSLKNVTCRNCESDGLRLNNSRVTAFKNENPLPMRHKRKPSHSLIKNTTIEDDSSRIALERFDFRSGQDNSSHVSEN